MSDNILNKIVAYLPEHLLVLQNVHVPKGAPFDPVLTASLRTIITLDPVDAAHTRVTEAQVGYGDGAGYADMYRHFHDGNAYELRQLAQKFHRRAGRLDGGSRADQRIGPQATPQ